MKKLFFIILLSMVFITISYSQEYSDLTKLRNERTNKYGSKSIYLYRKAVLPTYHKYYRKQEYDNMKKMLPDIEKAIVGVLNTNLPDIITDKDENFKKCKIIMKDALAVYEKACKNNDTNKLEESIIILKDLYLKMFTLTCPSKPSLEDFHILVFYIENCLLNNSNLEGIKNHIPLLKQNLASLMATNFEYYSNIVDPDNRKYDINKKQFDIERNKLSELTEDLIMIINSSDLVKIKESVITVHKQYHACDDLTRPVY